MQVCKAKTLPVALSGEAKVLETNNNNFATHERPKSRT
jgi:hypothetical protein